MPRTGGVYSPPAGTKGVPNTTIQSVPYNTLIDDLAADANAARPVTTGGTGATSASGARTALGVEIGTNVQAYDAGLQSIAGLVTVADQIIYTTALDVYATTALTPFARTLLDDADASAALTTLGVSDFMKTVLDDGDAATARATLGANNASNLTAGTVADARLPTTMAGKTFQSTISVTGVSNGIEIGPNGVSNTPFIDFHSSAVTQDYDVRLIASGGVAGTGTGTLTVSALSTLFQGGVSASGQIISNGGELVTKATGNRHVWFQNSAGTTRGLVYSDAGGDPGMVTVTYNSSGAMLHAQAFRDSGWADWTGNVSVRGSKLGYSGVEDRNYVDSNTFFRWYYASDNTAYLQRATNSAFSDAVNYIRFTALGEVVFISGLFAPYIDTSSNGVGTNIKFGDDAWLGDSNIPDGFSVRGVSNWNNGWVRFGNGPNNLGVNGSVPDRLYWGGGFFVQSDGNMYLPMYGNYLGNILMGRDQWWQNVTGSRAYNTTYQNTTGKGIVVSIACYNGSGNPMNFQVSTDGSNWVNVGQSVYDSTSGAPVQNHYPQGSYVVPHGSYYRLTGTGAPVVSFWSEMRN
ncbi:MULTISPECIES: hypothetical protein [unclassified Ensifer]|uniref:hypothetical protein n=1 Tax=unclassified Ensifer TaxID=2633371 RepID=UPI000B1D091F|nr:MULTISPECIES: hypothetical protein [unclassified Ensifer]